MSSELLSNHHSDSPLLKSSDPLSQLLKEKFRLPSFREGQREIIESILGGRDAMAVMPTGGGKSLCYQFPSVVSDGIVIVISPLIALMNDQVRSLASLNIPAVCVHSGISYADKAKAFRDLKRFKRCILFLSPERVQNVGFANWVKNQRVSLFAVDEAHCVSQWGPDFRKDYFRLNLLRELKPQVPILALTATATPPVLRDIESRLSLSKPDKHIHGFYRPNLFYQVEYADLDKKMSFVTQALSQFSEGRILIYCGTRNQTEEVVQSMSSQFAKVGFYHAGLSSEGRTRIQNDYSTGVIRILAATNAFGMGIDHPDVRLVIHFQMPANIESLYQEMGRSGRDGQNSTCLLLYSKRDKGLQSYFIRSAHLERSIEKSRWRALDTIVQYAEGGECRHSGILTYFRDVRRVRVCGHCDICDPSSPRKINAPFRGAKVIKAKGKTILDIKRKKKRSESDDGPLTPAESARYDFLRDWRKRYADEKDIPAFLVFSNKTLTHLAKANPKSLGALEKIHGLGDYKIAHLGALILKQLELTS